MKAVQYFSDEYLARCSAMSADEIARFLDDFRKVDGQPQSPSKLISIKVPESLLQAFKTKSTLNGLRYQTQIKVLMKEWLREP